MPEIIETAVARWFGPRFADLHPMLQALHRNGGTLSGRIRIEQSWLGRRLAKRLGIPADRTECGFTVKIRHEEGILHWERRFDDGERMISLFRPVGTWPEGYWRETTGAVRMDLTVDIIEGGWHWRALKASVGPVSVPLFLFPRVEAYKRIEQGRYSFSVSFTLPFAGTVLGYQGLLDLQPA